MTTATNWFLTAGTLRSAFVEKQRSHPSDAHTANTSEASVSFWACRDEIEIDSELKEFVRDLHDDELPNDWRYEMIVRILDQIVETSEHNDNPEWSDQPWAIAESLASIYTAELAAWFAENASRCDYHDEWNADCGIAAEASLSNRMRIAQFQCIESMAQRVLFKLGLL